MIRALICFLAIALLSVFVPMGRTQSPVAVASAPVGEQGASPQPTTNASSSADASKQAKAATDASGKVESAVVGSITPRDSADLYTKSIKAITGAITPRSSTPLEDFQTLQKIILAVQREDLLNALTKAKNSIDPSASSSLESARKTECDKLQQYVSLQQSDVIEAQSKCSEAGKKADDAFKALGASLTDLQTSLGGTYAFVASQVSALNDKLKTLKGLQSGADVAPLLQTLPGGLTVLKTVFEDQQQFDVGWKSIKPVLLTQLGIQVPPAPSGGTAPDVEGQFTALQSSIDSILLNLDGWFKKIADSLITSAKSVDTTITDVAIDPAKNSAEAVGAMRDERRRNRKSIGW